MSTEANPNPKFGTPSTISSVSESMATKPSKAPPSEYEHTDEPPRAEIITTKTNFPNDESLESWKLILADGRESPRYIKFEPSSYGVRSILLIAERKAHQYAEINGGMPIIDVPHLLLGITTLGWVYAGLNKYPDSLARSLSHIIAPSEEALSAFRSKALTSTVIHKERYPLISPELDILLERSTTIFNECTDGKFVAIRHLLAALLESSDRPRNRSIFREHRLQLRPIYELLARELKERAINDRPHEEERFENWAPIEIRIQGLMRAEEIGVETPVAMREAGKEQLCLNVDQLAAAVSETIQSAPAGDFCMAVKGQWGRGKTTLVKEIVSRLALPKDEALAENKNNASAKERTSTIPRTAIWFNAWKYPERPQVWVHLYQEIAAVASKGSLLHQLRLIFHQSLHAVGWLSLYSAVILLLASLAPKLPLIHHLAGTLGLSALLFLLFFFRNASAFARNLRLRYFTPVDHSSHLGLQATIGKDLRNLLMAWIKTNDRKAPPIYHFLILSALLLSCAILAWHRLSSGTPESNSTPDHLRYAYQSLISSLFIIATIMLWLLRPAPNGPDKVLLIADDLDRCSSEAMIGVIESLRLMLEDDEVSHRLQTLMLFDESILRDALEVKYAARLDRLQKGRTEKADETNSAEEFESKVKRLVQGQLEKYFILELHLPPLTKSEKKTYLNSLIAATDTESSKETRDSTGRTPSGANLNGANEDDSESQEKAKETTLDSGFNEYPQGDPTSPVVGDFDPRRTVEPGKYNFMPSELKLMEDLLADVPKEVASPRNIRSFVMRCQLAIYIISRRHPGKDTHKIIRAVAKCYYGIGEWEDDCEEYEVASHVV